MLNTFAHKLIHWQIRHGRHDLPWQGNRDPYAIWVSEIMLQQTQVTTVIPYYNRFMARFPNISMLAMTTEEDVLTCWAGLGYYARGRNLHKAAQIIQQRHAGLFPYSIDEVAALPGIGPSTAAAICVFAFGTTHAILDGNVKRVLARNFGIPGYPGTRSVENTLWQVARSLLPNKDLKSYTQGLMDLGATICTRVNPRCATCPVKDSCVALREKRINELPSPRPRKILPEKHVQFLVIRYGPDLFLEKRPVPGIWGGLWSLPEASMEMDPTLTCMQICGRTPVELHRLTPLNHAFSHFKLRIQPIEMRLSHRPLGISDGGSGIWLPLDDAKRAALPKAVERILNKLKNYT
jgi:A/G-specific adenine glycosylase